jgi:hypothetical protein
VKKILVLFAVVTVGCASSQSIGKDKYYHFAAGFAKETYDYLRYGGFDAKDLVATTLGGIIINYIIKKNNERKSKKIRR